MFAFSVAHLTKSFTRCPLAFFLAALSEGAEGSVVVYEAGRVRETGVSQRAFVGRRLHFYFSHGGCLTEEDTNLRLSLGWLGFPGLLFSFRPHSQLTEDIKLVPVEVRFL